MQKMESQTVDSLGDLFKEHGSLMCKWDVVHILTVKGNLRHRIDKLGEEVAEIALTDKQMRLRKVALSQNFDELISGHAARPEWGGGAFFYCDLRHASMMKRMMQVLPFDLQSKHVVPSRFLPPGGRP